MKKNKNIEKLFRKAFAGYEEKPADKVWEGVRQKLRWSNFLNFRWDSFNIYYLAGLLILGGAFWFMISNDPITPEIAEKSESEAMADTASEGTGEDMAKNPDVKENEAKEESSERQRSDIETPVMKETSEDLEQQQEEIKATIIDSLEEEKPIQKEPDSSLLTDELPPEAEEQLLSDTSKLEYTSIPKAFFIPSVFEGCVPLQVSFESNSPGAVKYEWSFGDGGSSDAEDPIYIFDEPGNYFVNLTVHGENNEISTYSEIITAFPNPVALFEMDIDDIPGDGKTVYFYNYSRGAEKYTWFFDDGTVSDLEEPTKIFEDENDHTIKLVAINTNGCKDSMILENAFAIDEPEIVFPNAFTPNSEGPTGGYYSDNFRSNDVFHPYMPEDPVEYTLRIFNKTGNLIFESNDPSIGWDGYYLQELQPQGVYIFKVKARFRNGKQIVKMGDVTLIHEERW